MKENYIQKAKVILASKIDVEEDLLDLYMLLVLTIGVDTSWKDVHDAWAIWKNKTVPNHKSLIPFLELPADVQELDWKYAMAIRETAEEIN